jgi:DNA mismatch repair protein MutS
MSVKETPMAQQYRLLRAQIPDGTLLLFRLGDFYELFYDDAQVSAKILNLTLTQRNGMPMAGIPYHAAESYIRRLLKSGYRVAVADQLEDPKPGQLVRREIIKVISPGTITEASSLDATQPNYIAAIFSDEKKHGLALLDCSTGEFLLGEFEQPETLTEHLLRLTPAEILTPANHSQSERLVPKGIPHSVHDAWAFRSEEGTERLREHYRTQSLDGFGCRHLTTALAAAGGLWNYCTNVLHRSLAHVVAPKIIRSEEFMVLDQTTRTTLELVQPQTDASASTHTLLGLLDKTQTPMGARRLRQWVLQPLRKINDILARQKAILCLQREESDLPTIRGILSDIRDVERILGRLTQGGGNARDLLALAQSLAAVSELRKKLAQLPPEQSLSFINDIEPLPELQNTLSRAINPDCPATLKDGGFIANGFDPTLDELRSAGTQGKDWIARLQAEEIQRTGIKSLKIRFNSVFGYYIEVTKSNLSSVPQHYIRKQTTANAERFITPELKEMENKILGAEERAKKLELEIFSRLRSLVLEHTEKLSSISSSIATLDALCSLAHVGRLHRYCMPTITEKSGMIVKDALHPVLSALPSAERFVPNDIYLDPHDARLLIITGPNMAGKSTYLRMTALIAIMAHIGSPVPAAEAQIGLLDRVFTRIGASDDLARGQSTFMVEMNETANILHHATERSLVILDEIGRGTATYDGLSIAWAVAEHLHNEKRCLTLFATHYHETTALAASLDAVRLHNIAVKEWNDEIIFLRKILPGPADKSYGIQVARLAGLPQRVLNRAKELLTSLEVGKPLTRSADRKSKIQDGEQTLFSHIKNESPQLNLL